MGVHRRLTEMQRKFAEELVNSAGTKNGTECAIAAGYRHGTVRAAELQNPKRFPLVVDYINELRKERKKIRDQRTDDRFNDILDKMMGFLNQATDNLNKDLEKGKYKKVATVIKSFEPIFNYNAHITRGRIKVYLAEEARPYHTNHYKIGKTGKPVEDRRSFTDNPFGINYICFIEYDSSSGFDLEKTFHKFFRFYSTKNFEYNGSSEWFLVKNRNRLISTFEKVGLSLLRKNKCVGFFNLTNTFPGDITSPKM